jgi:predicted nucleic acid-binding Zn ribbon protein
MNDATSTAEQQDEARRQEFFARANDIGRGVAMVLNATGAPGPLAIEGLSVATSLYLASLAKHNPQAAAHIANRLAVNLVDLCKELGLMPQTAEGAENGAQAPN